MAKPWKTKDIEKVRKLYYDGATFSAIAGKVARTRNSIAGLCNRLQFERAPKPVKPVVPKVAKEATQIIAKVKEIMEIFSPPPPPEKNQPKSLIDLQPRDCRWPIGDSDFQFCADEVVEGKPYCLKHCKIAYVPSRYAERSNA